MHRIYQLLAQHNNKSRGYLISANALCRKSFVGSVHHLENCVRCKVNENCCEVADVTNICRISVLFLAGSSTVVLSSTCDLFKGGCIAKPGPLPDCSKRRISGQKTIGKTPKINPICLGIFRNRPAILEDGGYPLKSSNFEGRAHRQSRHTRVAARRHLQNVVVGIYLRPNPTRIVASTL
jgi:hypothetical protein